MTGIEELCSMLDEREIEHTDFGGMTEWSNGDGRICRAYTRLEPLTVDVAMIAVTPEQAIAATLGPEVCHTVAMDCFGNPPYNQSGLNGNSTACGCSECGAPWSTVGLFRGNQLRHNFKACPICGRRIEP